MTAKDIWKELTERHPKWADPDHICKLTARGMKALIDQAFDEGYRELARNITAIDKKRDQYEPLQNPFNQFFKNKP